MRQGTKTVFLAVLTIAVVAAAAPGVIAGFSDAEVSAVNRMKASNNKMILVVSGGPITVENAWPCCWKYEDFTLINASTKVSVPGTASVHIANLQCHEDAPGAGVATYEPELVAEEGGWMDILIPPPDPSLTPEQNLARPMGHE